jgi:hypothetical protein
MPWSETSAMQYKLHFIIDRESGEYSYTPSH